MISQVHDMVFLLIENFDILLFYLIFVPDILFFCLNLFHNSYLASVFLILLLSISSFWPFRMP